MEKKSRSPQDKKALSYKRDRRNTYGESPHGARKSIPKNKRHVNRANRLAETQPLRKLRGTTAVANSDAVEDVIKGRRPKVWRKLADAPLGKVVEGKRRRRELSHGAKARRRARKTSRGSTGK